MSQLTLPHDWQPRPYQRPLWRYLADGGKRAVAVWHRRSGKDSLALNWTACALFKRPGLYWHMLPTARQGRKVIWDGIDRQGRRLIDQAFPPALRTSTNATEMKIGFAGGSLWQVVGSDNYDALVGANPCGIVFSEWSLTDPAAWTYLRPILRENAGWALFIFTPRGRNHGWTLYDLATQHGDWFAQTLTVADTSVLSEAEIEAERKDGMSEEMIAQEFYCDFDIGMPGAYYAKEFAQLEQGGRLGEVPWDPRLPVHTGWDLGIGDSTAIWFAQREPLGDRFSLRLIDYYEASGVGASHYAKIVRDKPYTYGEHFLPHDAANRDWGSGQSRVDSLATLGLRVRVLPRPGAVEDGIEAVRVLLGQCRFDRAKTARGLEALRQYRKEWDERLHMFRLRPRHDWTSHGADAFRTLAQGLATLPRSERDRGQSGREPARARDDYDPFAGL